jgi:hypothetical protein
VAIIDRVLERIETDVAPEELQNLIDEALTAIEDRWGPPADDTNPIVVTKPGGSRVLSLARPIDAAKAVTIVETMNWYGPGYGASTQAQTLAAGDYRIWHNGRTLERLGSGTHAAWRWGHPTTISYVPVNDGDQRQEVAIKLVQLSLQYKGLISYSSGDVNVSYNGSTGTLYTQERENLLRSLAPRSGFYVA